MLYYSNSQRSFFHLLICAGTLQLHGTNKFLKQIGHFINNKNISNSSSEIIIHSIYILHSKVDTFMLGCNTLHKGFELTVLQSRSTFHTKVGNAHLCENQLSWGNWRSGPEWMWGNQLSLPLQNTIAMLTFHFCFTAGIWDQVRRQYVGLPSIGLQSHPRLWRNTVFLSPSPPPPPPFFFFSRAHL